MSLKPGCRFVVAPHFHVPVEWSQRLLIGSGVREADDSFFLNDSWRAPTGEELHMLVGNASEMEPADLQQSCVCLFQLPEHLGVEWWKLLETSADVLGGGTLPGFESFAGRVGEFLAFKGLVLPDGASFNVIVSKPAAPHGLLSSLCSWASQPWGSDAGWPGPWGGINLGDEPISVVLINLGFEQLAAEVLRRDPGTPLPATVGELAARFLRNCPEYPPIRLIVGPGEGYRLPDRGMILGAYPQDKPEPEVLLLISRDASPFTW